MRQRIKVWAGNSRTRDTASAIAASAAAVVGAFEAWGMYGWFVVAAGLLFVNVVTDTPPAGDR